MQPSVIHASAPGSGVVPNLIDYDLTCAGFSWETARAALAGSHQGGLKSSLNIGHLAVDRHLPELADKPALRLVRIDGSVNTVTYAQLAEDTNRFANVLRTLGVASGERVFTLLGRRYETFVACLGALKNRSVVSPLFTDYGTDPVCQRLKLGDGAVLVTTRSQFVRKVAGRESELPGRRHVLLVDDEGGGRAMSFHGVLAQASAEFEVPDTDPEDLALLHFTSGTTGTPKGALHVHGAVVGHWTSAALALDLHDDDIFWCTADPGWVTGTSYGVIAPLTAGVTEVVDEGDFEPERWWHILASQHVTVWYTAPTALRMLMHMPLPSWARAELALRLIASVGEPLNPEVVLWGQRELGLPVHDTWWQTETGSIMVANFLGCDIRPGSMGRPMPGIEAGLVATDDEGGPVLVEGHLQFVTTHDRVGMLALRAGWPSMFRGYLHEEDRYRACFRDGWYLSGDLAKRDRDGWYWFLGRSDDVIKTAGHLIGPFEIESALLEHPAVTEAAAVGRPDPVAGAVIRAFVTVQPPFEPDDALRLELLGFARKKLGPAVAPREIVFSPDLPHTQSGKIVRRLLRELP